ncbi:MULTISPECIES: hypothetical protein [Brevibacillus]|jgi:hypothetical protein|uniref:Uncharacterized protein n=1 Tax=Brevibacillus borstelensis AK1 TaxID=1300222 RepID=M8DBF6_9BACL|nr:hypothetical protein [Brevibacillus borstelensis]EMT50748.1 hypothetical protein I532_20586 [Brevibacillus borstelensis AK1]KKX55936.1 hypothetical protein X546_09895 [Brevibacillus borstelensis cifa_chp40]MBE5396759.1 hypothetical protein [Brevibacillus borstelensis]MCC0564497.1 hypothetical protein [Brevibacillus borstelensis]MCM3471149.1 hypothetical protein [Brevibacillus borstelensis]
MRDYLLFCNYCRMFTLLHSYNRETGMFLGEYSLLHNEYTRNSIVLNRFLLAHVGHVMRVIPSKTEEFQEIICTAAHFLQDDIDKFVEESLALEKYKERDRRSEREIGLVQLYILEHLLVHELENITEIRASTPAEGQVLLGRELGLKRALELLRSALAEKQALE